MFSVFNNYILAYEIKIKQLNGFSSNKFKFSTPKVKWATDTVEGYLNFYSASGDGKVINWTIVKTSLISATMMNIPFCERLENFNRVEAQKKWKGIFFFA